VTEPGDKPTLFVQALPGSFGDLGPLGKERTLEAGTTLWREGDPGEYVVLLLSGRLEVSHQTPDGEEIILRHLYPGSVVGEMAAVDGEPRSATVRAPGDSRVRLIPADGFRQFLKERPDVLEQLFWLQLERVRSLTWRVSRTHHRAITDPLTGLYNYGFFRERLALELERAQLTGDPLALIMFDIDHFKNYNDTRGHQEGNRVLVKVAEILKETGRRGDVVARYGGEEFVALLYGAGASDAWRFAETFRNAISAGPSRETGGSHRTTSR
jgi:diguanylate cyclase (GGDEF)-like protein